MREIGKHQCSAAGRNPHSTGQEQTGGGAAREKMGSLKKNQSKRKNWINGVRSKGRTVEGTVERKLKGNLPPPHPSKDNRVKRAVTKSTATPLSGHQPGKGEEKGGGTEEKERSSPHSG